MRLSLRFQKYDNYGNPIFIANSTKEPEQFKKLQSYHHQLAEQKYETFLPIYSNVEKEYATIRFKGSVTKFETNDVWDLTFDVKKNEREDKIFIGCYISDLAIVSKAPPVDLGESIVFT